MAKQEFNKDSDELWTRVWIPRTMLTINDVHNFLRHMIVEHGLAWDCEPVPKLYEGAQDYVAHICGKHAVDLDILIRGYQHEAKGRTDTIMQLSCNFEDFKTKLQEFDQDYTHPDWDGYLDGVVEGLFGDLNLLEELEMIFGPKVSIDCDTCGEEVLEKDIHIGEGDTTICFNCKREEEIELVKRKLERANKNLR